MSGSLMPKAKCMREPLGWGYCRSQVRWARSTYPVSRRPRVHVEHLFLARLWSREEDPRGIQTLVYRKLIEVAGETVVEGDFCLA